MPEQDDLLPPPVGVSPAAAAWWRGYVSEMAEDHDAEPDASDLAVMVEIARHMTLAERLEVALQELDSIVVKGSRANDRVHPVVGELDRARKTIAALIRSIRPPADRAAIGRANIAGRYRR